MRQSTRTVRLFAVLMLIPSILRICSCAEEPRPTYEANPLSHSGTGFDGVSIVAFQRITAPPEVEPSPALPDFYSYLRQT